MTQAVHQASATDQVQAAGLSQDWMLVELTSLWCLRMIQEMIHCLTC